MGGGGERQSEKTGRSELPASARWVSVAALCLAACSQAQPEPEPVEVGVAVPFAGTDLMLEARQGWELVLDSINDAGGVNGRPLAVLERDTPLAAADDLPPAADGFVVRTSGGVRYLSSVVAGGARAPMLEAATTSGVLAMSITSEEPAAQLADYDALLLRGILSTDRLLEKQALSLQAAGLRRIAIVGPSRAGVTDARHTAMR